MNRRELLKFLPCLPLAAVGISTAKADPPPLLVGYKQSTSQVDIRKLSDEMSGLGIDHIIFPECRFDFKSTCEPFPITVTLINDVTKASLK